VRTAAERHARGMYTAHTPSAVVARHAGDPQLPPGEGERFAAHGIMGLAFDRGHYLALRDMSATSIGPAYRAVWHRDPSGSWSIFTTVAPELSCPRYFGEAASHIEQVDGISVTWTDDHAFRVRMGPRLDWQVTLGRTAPTAMMSAMGRAMPDIAWRSEALLAGMGPMAGAVLRSGRVRLHGNTPNGQHFRAAPVQIWRVADSRAVLDGVDFGVPGPLDRQTHMADFWMPQRGIFFVGAFVAIPTARQHGVGAAAGAASEAAAGTDASARLGRA